MPAVPKRCHFFIVRVPATLGTKGVSSQYVRDAVRGWGGGYMQDHPFSKYNDRKRIVVTNTLYEMEKETLMNLRKDLSQALSGPETRPGGHAHLVDEILLSYLRRA